MTIEEARRSVFWRNALLLCATIAFCCSVAFGPKPWLVINSGCDRLALIVLLAGACCVAMGIRELAKCFFDVRAMPWYAQRGGILFLSLMLVGVNWTMVRFYPSFADAARTSADAMSPNFLCAAVAAEVLAVVVLDWAPSLPRERRKRASRRDPGTQTYWPSTRSAPRSGTNGAIGPSRKPRKPSKLKKLLRWFFDRDNC